MPPAGAGVAVRLLEVERAHVAALIDHVVVFLLLELGFLREPVEVAQVNDQAELTRRRFF